MRITSGNWGITTYGLDYINFMPLVYKCAVVSDTPFFDAEGMIHFPTVARMLQFVIYGFVIVFMWPSKKPMKKNFRLGWLTGSVWSKKDKRLYYYDAVNQEW